MTTFAAQLPKTSATPVRRQPDLERVPAAAPAAVHETLRGAGQPLDPATRAFMEPRFGHDFSRVRVHTDARASTSAEAVHAHAYTVGRDIVFAAGTYTPGAVEGRRLLAHELTHVVQQRPASRPGLQAKLEIGEPGDACERQADRIAHQVTRTLAAPSPTHVHPQPIERVHTQAAPRLMRQPRTPGGGTPAGGPPGGGPSTGRAAGEILSETTRPDGTVVIRSRVGRSPGRLGLEEALLPGVEVSLSGWERAHSQGNITGAESAMGIRYAPPEVNQQLQRLGIERAIRDLHGQKAPNVEIVLTTETRAHPNTLRLAEIVYKIELVRPGGTLRVYEASIMVRNSTTAPRPQLSPPEPIGWSSLEDGGWLRDMSVRSRSGAGAAPPRTRAATPPAPVAAPPAPATIPGVGVASPLPAAPAGGARPGAGRPGGSPTGGGRSGPGAGGAFSVGLGLAYGILIHPRAVERRRDVEGYAPVGPQALAGEDFLTRLGRWLADPFLETNVPLQERINIPVWRERIRAAAGGKQPGETLQMIWQWRDERELLSFTRDITVVYTKQPDGTWRAGSPSESPPGFVVPDLNRIVGPASDEAVRDMLFPPSSDIA